MSSKRDIAIFTASFIILISYLLMVALIQPIRDFFDDYLLYIALILLIVSAVFIIYSVKFISAVIRNHAASLALSKTEIDESKLTELKNKVNSLKVNEKVPIQYFAEITDNNLEQLENLLQFVTDNYDVGVYNQADHTFTRITHSTSA